MGWLRERPRRGQGARYSLGGGPAQRITIVEELFSPLVGARLRCGVLQDLADLQADFDGPKLAEALNAPEPAASNARLQEIAAQFPQV